MPLIKKEELQKLILEIETYKFYNKPNMQPAKENWLSKLKPVLENYDTMPEDDDKFMTCAIINAYHLLNLVNMQSTAVYAESIKEILTFTKTIVEKGIEAQKVDNDNPPTTNT
jgi:hypothetical protein